MKNRVLVIAIVSMLLSIIPIHTVKAAELEWKTGEDGKQYWYEFGVKQGMMGDPKNIIDEQYGEERGREIYDPGTNGWYWLDAIYNGAKAVDKEVWMPYVYQDERNWSEDEISINADASGTMSEQVRNAIHNRTGKWVRYDATGKMYKGWYKVQGRDAQIYPDQAGNVYYYDEKTGLMAKGWTTIDGIDFYFDETTGVLINALYFLGGWNLEPNGLYFYLLNPLPCDIANIGVNGAIDNIYTFDQFQIAPQGSTVAPDYNFYYVQFVYGGYMTYLAPGKSQAADFKMNFYDEDLNLVNVESVLFNGAAQGDHKVLFNTQGTYFIELIPYR